MLTKNPNLGGKVTIKFVIAKDGSVSKASVKSSTMGNKSVEGCITGRFMRFKFPEPKGGGIVIVSYPFIFAPGWGPWEGCVRLLSRPFASPQDVLRKGPPRCSGRGPTGIQASPLPDPLQLLEVRHAGHRLLLLPASPPRPPWAGAYSSDAYAQDDYDDLDLDGGESKAKKARSKRNPRDPRPVPSRRSPAGPTPRPTSVAPSTCSTSAAS